MASATREPPRHAPGPAPASAHPPRRAPPKAPATPASGTADAKKPPSLAATLGAGGPGESLPKAVSEQISKSLGVNVNAVRVHTDANAAAAAKTVGARAFAVGTHVFLAAGEKATDVALMAHEVSHVIQQRGTPGPRVQLFSPASVAPLEREAQHAATAVVQRRPFSVLGRTPPRVQRLGLRDALDYFAEKAYLIPGYRMFTIVIGINPINMSSTDRSAANILRAIVEFIPGGALITQALDNYGVFEKAGAWVETQIRSLGLTGAMFKQALDQFLDSLSWRDIFHLGDLWDRAKAIFTAPIARLIDFAAGLITGILTLIKDAILRPLAKLAEGTRAWDLLIAVLGHNPITGDAVPRTAETLIAGFLKLIGQEEVWANMQKSNAIGRAWAWFQGAMAALMGFVGQIPSLFIAALKSLEIADIVLLPRAFIKVGKVFGNFVGDFISWGLKAVWNLLEIIFDVVSPGALGYIKKTGAALKSILKNPLPFVGNLVKAAKLGFQNFASNFGTHLKAGLIDWLTGSLPGIYIPKGFSLVEIAKFVFSVLGLTWDNIRQKLVKATSEPIVKAMETGFDIVKTLVTGGVAAAWDKIKEQLSNLKDMAIGAITDFVVDMVVKKAVPKLIAMFIPGAGFISAILSIYDTVMVFVNKIKTIIQVVTGFIDSIVAIAAGAIGAAASKVEGILARLLSLAINFLAGFAGLGKVADKVMGIIQKIRAPIDKALDWLIGWIVGMAKKLFSKVFGKKDKPDERTDAQKQADLDRAAGEANALLADPNTSADEVRAKLPAIKAKYKLTELTLVSDAEQETTETDHIVAVINPEKKGPTTTKPKRMPKVTVTFTCFKKYNLAAYKKQVAGQEAGMRELLVKDFLANRDRYEKEGRSAEGSAEQDKLREKKRKQLEAQKKSKAEIQAVMDAIAALHEPDQIAGGEPVCEELGDRRINSSIGSQWKSRIEKVQAAAEKVPAAMRAKWKMNVELKVERP